MKTCFARLIRASRLGSPTFSISISVLLFILLLALPNDLRLLRLEAAQVRSVRINGATLARGENGTVTIDLLALGDENAVGFSISFDPTELAFVSAVAGSGAAGTNFNVNSLQAGVGRVGVTVAKSPGTSFTAGTHQIAVLTFTAVASGTDSTTPVDFGDSPVFREVVNVNAQALTASFVNGSVIIIDPPCTYTITPQVRHFSALSSQGTVEVTTGSGCGWNVVNNTPWVLVTGGGSGVGNGTVTFQVEANSGGVRSGTMMVAGKTFTIRQGANFADVELSNIFYEFIGKLSAAGVTTGCGFTPEGQSLYCPSQPVTREQMAAFLMRALGEPNPPPPPTQRFIDVPPHNFFYAFIDRLALLQITLGCGDSIYCPEQSVLREQMSAFIMRALGEHSPPPPAMQRFADVPPQNFFYAFIERLAIRQITLGCGTNEMGLSIYCPSDPVTREQMAAFLVRAFGF